MIRIYNVLVARDLYLLEKRIIVSLDAHDLHAIIKERKNLLECIERKREEIKSNATSNLVALGLYDA